MAKTKATRNEFAKRIDPPNFNFSPKMAAIAGAIIGHDYGVRDRKGGRLTSLSITSGGFVICGSTAHKGGAMVADAEELERNLEMWKADLSAEDRAEFERIYKARVIDHRLGAAHIGTPQHETFDPAALEAEAKRMLRNGTMPSPAQLEAALARIREQFGPKTLEARERDRREAEQQNG